MFAYAVRRIVLAIPVLIAVTLGIHLSVSAVTDPRAHLATCSTCDQSAYDRIIDLYDLDDPPIKRYINWLGDFVSGDMGTSTSQGERPVSELYGERLANTLYLAVPALILLMILGLFSGVYSALRQYSIGDYFVTAISYLGLSMPTFFFGLTLQVMVIWLLNATGWKPFYTSGMRDPFQFGFIEYLRSVTLPTITLMFVLLAGDSRFIRAAVLDIRNADYVRTARAKGVPERRVVGHHILRNALIPAVTVWALDVAALFGGSLITESIFSWPGFGRLLIDAIFAADLDVVMAVAITIAVLVIAMNLIADLLYGVLDPRVRYD